MLYIVSVKLKENSGGILNYLRNKGFQIYKYSPLTGTLDDYKDHTIKTHYKCIYNGQTLPQQEVLKKLEENAVTEFLIEKRQT